VGSIPIARSTFRRAMPRTLPIRGLRDQIHICSSCDEASDNWADDGMIIDRWNPNRAEIAAHDLLRALFRKNFSAHHERRGDAALA
jgi:hypothetical protein